jgi:hypothetical protein
LTVFFSIPLINRIHGIDVNAVGTINKSKADQLIFFEIDLKKDDFFGRIGEVKAFVKQSLCGPTPMPTESI